MEGFSGEVASSVPQPFLFPRISVEGGFCGPMGFFGISLRVVEFLSRVLSLEILRSGNARLHQTGILLAGCGADLEVVTGDKTIGGIILPSVDQWVRKQERKVGIDLPAMRRSCQRVWRNWGNWRDEGGAWGRFAGARHEGHCRDGF